MGPWTHGAWSAREWTRFGTYEFGSNTSAFFRDSVETVFFNYYLKDKGKFQPAEATLFNTGTSTWSQFKSWPPLNTVQVSYYFAANKKLATAKSGDPDSYSEYLSDPDNPVPYTNGIFRNRNNEYMVEDQRFAAQRPDVIYFESDVLMEDLTLAGGISADLFVTTTGTDADFVIKLIDVLPDNEPNLKNPPRGFTMSNMQRLVRAEVFRGKFRNSYTRPEAFVPGKISRVRVALNDVLHTFKKGHRIMVQIQSSWFPLVDRNPQKFMRIPEADESDFQKARIRIYHDPEHSSKILLPVLK